MLKRFVFMLIVACMAVFAGGCGSKAANAGKKSTSVKVNREEPRVKRKVVQAADGSYYEVLEEYERLCEDCDR